MDLHVSTTVRPKLLGASKTPLNKGMSDSFYCAAPWRGLHINPRGDVKTCCAGDPNMLGNLNTNNIIEILNGDLLQEIRGSIAQDAGFQDWVKSSKVRLALFAKADGEFDFDSADELLSTYKELRQVKQQTQVTQTANVESKAQEQAMRAASVDVGGAGESSRKVYRRADLIKLKLTDPSRYEALQDDILAAYAEGRVK